MCGFDAGDSIHKTPLFTNAPVIFEISVFCDGAEHERRVTRESKLGAYVRWIAFHVFCPAITARDIECGECSHIEPEGARPCVSMLQVMDISWWWTVL